MNENEEKNLAVENTDKELKETEVNGIKISEEVVATIAGIAASEVKGVHGLNGGIVEGFSGIFGKKSFSKGVKVQVTEKDATIDLYITVEYGCRILDIAWEIQKRVTTSVENMTGLKVLEANVHVQSVYLPKEGKNEKVEESNANEDTK